MVLSYDLAWSPLSVLTPFALGIGTPAARAVPSDAFGVVLGHVLGGAVAEKAVLFAILVSAALGAAALLRHLRAEASLGASCATVTVALWNPFVAERLVIGQWTILLGYAVLPWALREGLRIRAARGSLVCLGGWVVLAGLGGANALVVVIPGLLVVLLWPRPLWRASLVVLVAGLAVGAAWWIPSVSAATAGDPRGFAAFAARPDGPLGLLGSVATGGGLWNPASHPPERANPVLAVVTLAIAVAAVARAARVRRARPLLAAGALGLLAACLGGWDATASMWSALSHLPGGGLLRDGQKLAAPWMVLLAVGVGLLVDAVPGRVHGLGTITAVALALAAVLSLPSLAWGVHGRLTAVEVPADLRAAAAVLSAAPPGEVGVLPWRQYRRYAWNGDRVSLSLVPRMVDQRVLFDDSLPLSTGRIAGEDPRSAAVTATIDRGSDPFGALADAGVRYVVVERGTGLDVPAVPTDPGTVLFEGAHVLVLDRGPQYSVGAARLGVSGWVGWSLTVGTLALSAGLCVARHTRRFANRWAAR